MRHRAAGAQRGTGPLGPVSISALLLLLVLSPLWRGGNRQVPLILLEAVALAFLVATAWPSPDAGGRAPRPRFERALLLFLCTSPLWLAIVYLFPLPGAAWQHLAGRADYASALATAGIQRPDWMPLSLVPDATAVSLLAGIPAVAAFVGGLLLRVSQLRTVLLVVVGMAFFEVVLGLLQVAGGANSFLYFDAIPGRPIGTWFNANHYANYLGMALTAYIWLGWATLSESDPERHAQYKSVLPGNRVVRWIAGGLFLALGLLVSRSRGAAIGGLGAALLALGIALTLGSRTIPWRTALLIVGGSLIAAVLLAGADMVVSRFDVSRLTSDASVRGMLATSTLEGAFHLWPWGAGWGTYAAVYPKYQPLEMIGFAEYAHQDYAQLLFEGGLFAALLMAAFAWLAVRRVVVLVRSGRHKHRLGRDEMAAALCGCALLGFLVHSLAEFNMHIPANAILAALLAGAFLRPLKAREATAAASEEEPAGD